MQHSINFLLIIRGQIKKAQARIEYFQKEIQLQSDKNKKMKEKMITVIKDTDRICKSYNKIISLLH